MDYWSLSSNVAEDELLEFGDFNAADDVMTPPTPPPSPAMCFDEDLYDDPWSNDKENFDLTDFDIELMPIEVLTAGSLMQMDPRGTILYELIENKLNEKSKKKEMRKKKNRRIVIRPLRL